MNETTCAGTLGVGACGCTGAFKILGAGAFLGAETVKGRDGAAIGAVGQLVQLLGVRVSCSVLERGEIERMLVQLSDSE